MIRLGFHIYGAGNVGDDLMLDGFLSAWPEREKLVSKHPLQSLRVLRRRFPGIAWHPPTARLPDYHWWLGVGDTPIQILSTLYFLRYLEKEFALRRHRDCEFGMIGIGAEAEARQYAARFRKVLERCAFIATRDAMTAEVICEGLKVKSVPLMVGADLAHLFLARQKWPTPCRRRHIELAVNYYSERIQPEYSRAVARYLNAAARAGREVAFLAHEVRTQYPGLEMDQVRSWARQPDCKLRGVRVLSPDYWRAATTGELVAVYDEIQTVVSARYHALLSAAWSGCRVCGIGRSSKIRGLCEELNIPLITPEVTAETLAHAEKVARIVPRAVLKRREAEARQMITFAAKYVFTS